MTKDQFTVTPQIPEPARTLAAILQSRLKLPRRECLQLIQEGGVRVNGRCCTRSFQSLQPGDVLEVNWIRQPSPVSQKHKTNDSRTFRVEFEDELLLVVYKPANLLTVPTPHRESNTLQSMVTTHLKRNGSLGQAYCVHRLDRGVSGLLVFAKSLDVAEFLRDQFAARKPERKYLALCAGRFEQNQGTIRSYLATDESLNRFSTTDTDRGELAITHFTVTQRWEDATMLQVQLETGRRNQIRVHLAEAGHPILGDPRYRAHQATHHAWPYRRLALHAESLGFEHPTHGQRLSFECSWPDEFRSFQRKMTRRKT